MTEQLFLVSVERMCTCDEVDAVVRWSAVVSEADLPSFQLEPLAAITAKLIDGSPLTNVRPMTAAEIRAWRDEQ